MTPEEMKELEERAGSRERLAQAVQRRLRELSRGLPPRIDVESETPDFVEVALRELYEGKVEMRQERQPRRRGPAGKTAGNRSGGRGSGRSRSRHRSRNRNRRKR